MSAIELKYYAGIINRSDEQKDISYKTRRNKATANVCACVRAYARAVKTRMTVYRSLKEQQLKNISFY